MSKHATLLNPRENSLSQDVYVASSSIRQNTNFKVKMKHLLSINRLSEKTDQIGRQYYLILVHLVYIFAAYIVYVLRIDTVVIQGKVIARTTNK